VRGDAVYVGRTLHGAQQKSERVQSGARRRSSDGIHGNHGNVVTVSYRIYRRRSGSNPTLSAKLSPLESMS